MACRWRRLRLVCMSLSVPHQKRRLHSRKPPSNLPARYRYRRPSCPMLDRGVTEVCEGMVDPANCGPRLSVGWNAVLVQQWHVTSTVVHSCCCCCCREST